MRKISLAILLVPALAWAQSKTPKTPGDWYKEGENQYILGNFEKAVEAFKQGFSLETDEDKRAKYVFNIAQSYRQANDCAKAHFFYKRFLALKANPKLTPLEPQLRQSVEDRVKDLEACAQQAAAISKRPPDSLPGEPDENGPPGNTEVRKDPRVEERTAAVPGDTLSSDEDERSDTGEPTAVAVRPHVISARVTGGGAKVNLGKYSVPVQATFTLVAGYPIPVNDKLTIDAGIAFTLTPVPWSVMSPVAKNGTGLLTGLMANGGVAYEVAPKVALRADVGLGVLLFSGVSESQFIDEQRPTTGALSMFHVRAAASADYAFTPNIVGTITPIAFSFSPAKKDMDASIKNIRSIDFMLGIGYRM